MVGGARCPPSVGILAVCGTALFVTLRLPTGNLWDALLDPLLWVVLHWMGLRWLWARKWGRS